jgi:hypothetical protein
MKGVATQLPKNALPKRVWVGVDNRDYHHLSHPEIRGGKRIYQQLPPAFDAMGKTMVAGKCFFVGVASSLHYLHDVRLRYRVMRLEDSFRVARSSRPESGGTL